MKQTFFYAVFLLLISNISLYAQQIDNFADDHFGSRNAYSNHNSEIYNPLAGSFLTDQESSNHSGVQQGNQQWNNSFSIPNNPSSIGGEMYGPLEVP